MCFDACMNCAIVPSFLFQAFEYSDPSCIIVELSLALFTLHLLMAIIRPLHNIYPVFGKNCFLADNAAIIGDVIMGDDCSVWWSAVVRGDVNAIRIGDRVNIQDGAVIH